MDKVSIDLLTVPGVETLYADNSHSELGPEKEEKGVPYYFVECKHYVTKDNQHLLLANSAFIDVQTVGEIDNILENLVRLSQKTSTQITLKVMLQDSLEVAILLRHYGFTKSGPNDNAETDGVYEGIISSTNSLLRDFFKQVEAKINFDPES